MKFTQIFREGTSSNVSSYINQYFGFDPIAEFPEFEAAVSGEKLTPIKALYALEGECSIGQTFAPSDADYAKVLRRNQAIIMDMAMTALETVPSFESFKNYLAGLHVKGKAGNLEWKNSQERDQFVNNTFREIRQLTSSTETFEYVARNLGITEEAPIKYSIRIVPYLLSKIIGSAINVASGKTVGASAASQKTNILGKDRPLIKEFCAGSGEDEDVESLYLNVIFYTLMAMLFGNAGMKGYYGLQMYTSQVDRRGAPLSRDPTTGDREVLVMLDSYLEPDNKDASFISYKSKDNQRGFINFNPIARDIAIGRETVENAKMEYSDSVFQAAMAELGTAKQKFERIDSKELPFNVLASLTCHWIYISLKALTDEGSRRLNGLKAPDRKYWSQEELEELKTKDPARYEIAVKRDNAAWEAFNANRGKGLATSISLDKKIGADGDATVGDLIASSSDSMGSFIDDDVIEDAITSLEKRLHDMEQLAVAGAINKEGAEPRIRAAALYSTLCLAKFLYMSINYPALKVSAALSATVGQFSKQNRGKLIVSSTKKSTTIDFGAEKGSIKSLDPGVNNSSVREALLILKGIGAIKFFKSNDDALHDLNSELSSVYNSCRSNLEKLLKDNNLSMDRDNIVPASIYKPGDTKITPKISDFGSNFSLQGGDWKLNTEFEGKPKGISHWHNANVLKKLGKADLGKDEFKDQAANIELKNGDEIHGTVKDRYTVNDDLTELKTDEKGNLYQQGKSIKDDKTGEVNTKKRYVLTDKDDYEAGKSALARGDYLDGEDVMFESIDFEKIFNSCFAE